MYIVAKTGTITIAIGLENSSTDKWAYCHVSDTGIGIPNEKLDTIFEEFRHASKGFDRHYEGTGLGLTITKKLTERINGCITVQSEVRSGSVFTVKFPAYIP